MKINEVSRRYAFGSCRNVRDLKALAEAVIPMNLPAARHHIQSRLAAELPDALTYHNAEHTADVCRAALNLARLEGVMDETALGCLELACLMHDAGFIKSPHKHEQRACALVDEWLPEFGVGEEERALIKELILATELHSPATTQLEQIMQDADLDYLGRSDYSARAEGLREELNQRGQRFSEEDWIEFQIHFLSTHRYKTASARELRQAGKQAHLEALKERLYRK